MDPPPAAEVAGETKERRKIKFSVPAIVSSQLDARQVEMIRRRRPTPATLFRVADPSSPDDDSAPYQSAVGENGILKPKRVNQNVYQPPSLKAVQRMAQAHMQTLGAYPTLEDPPEGEEYEDELSMGPGDSQVLGSQSEAPQRPEALGADEKEDEEGGEGRGRGE
ncbi:protein phosphatase 1 regulatory subunit 1B-like isoform X1 [Anguilla rostrata]|uniref:protein phosphatase 1 regulatory subunit 1B-like isoform X1 n=1 Tax=Anguilla rostrata TaxID=7938 RepID=UPI0030CBE1A8